MEEHHPPPFFIGHHDPRRSLPITYDGIQDAHAANVSQFQQAVRPALKLA